MSWARNSVGERGDNIGLPDVTTADNGKIMEVESGEWKLKEGSGGGGGIPAPASPSNGDVLTYSSTDSAWIAAPPSGGGSVLLITNNNGTLNKTGQQIADAFLSGSVCIIIKQTVEDGFTTTERNIVVEYTTAGSEADGYFYDFVTAGFSGSGLVASIYECTNLADYPSVPH